MGRKDIYKDAVPFTSENQPEKRGRPQGSKNRSTILKKWLLAELDIVNPITKDKERGTVEDEVMLALITQARKGDIPAIREVLDTMYGKLTDKTELASKDGGPIEIKVTYADTRKGNNGNPSPPAS